MFLPSLHTIDKSLPNLMVRTMPDFICHEMMNVFKIENFRYVPIMEFIHDCFWLRLFTKPLVESREITHIVLLNQKVAVQTNAPRPSSNQVSGYQCIAVRKPKNNPNAMLADENGLRLP